MNVFEERRFGTFSFDTECIKTEPAAVQALMAEAIVIRAEHLFDRDVIEYTALHPTFEPVEPGERPHRYDVLFTLHPDGTKTFAFHPQA